MEDAPVSAQVEDVPDQDMPENGAAEDAEEEEEEEEEEVEAQRVKILPGSTDTAASFEFLEEGHTMGNALRYIIMKNPDGTAIDALKKGLGDLQQVCDVVADEFMTKRQQFNDENGIDR
ncbi:RNA polymerase subunit AC19 [Beauveria asiatica]|uniref:RNA polymerase subunit AC19 n=1 Tax=Beauveria asiatica TaxID=1069075 RepID=A0AAW0S523_9HYPO